MTTTLALLSAGSTLHGARPCAAAFTRQTGIAVDVATDHGHVIAADLRREAAKADVVLLPTDMVAALTAEGYVAADGQVSLGRVGIAAATRAGAPSPDIATLPALAATLRAASTVLLTRAPTGEHMQDVFLQLGLAGTIAAKLRSFDTASLLLRYLSEQGDDRMIGFAPSAEIMVWRDRDIAFAGAVPDDIQVALPYAAAMRAAATESAAAQALLAFLRTPESIAMFRESGVIA